MLLNLRTILSKFNFLLNESTIQCNRNFNKATRKRRKPNPGINLQAKLLNEEKGADLEEADFEELETDFMNVSTSHRQHVRQVEMLKEKQKYLIIKQKYFKERTPNFLTWSDKLQIRHLHNTDPALWTIEKLSEGFPALPDVIARIIKGDWMKKNSRIQNHDAVVASNWSLFKKGQMTNLPSHLVEHLNKFTDREFNYTSFDIHEEKPSSLSNNLVHGEFSDIITSYERIKDKNNSSNKDTRTNDEREERKPQRETYVDNTETFESHGNFKYKKHVTLSHLQKELEENAENDVHDQFLLQKLHENQKTLAAMPENPVIEITVKDNSKTSHLSILEKEKKDYNHLTYPQKITVPKHKYKHGYTYKLNDCYYDSDGLFLYRVPGMDK